MRSESCPQVWWASHQGELVLPRKRENAAQAFLRGIGEHRELVEEEVAWDALRVREVGAVERRLLVAMGDQRAEELLGVVAQPAEVVDRRSPLVHDAL